MACICRKGFESSSEENTAVCSAHVAPGSRRADDKRDLWHADCRKRKAARAVSLCCCGGGFDLDLISDSSVVSYHHESR